jgi:hypothetical protein
VLRPLVFASLVATAVGGGVVGLSVDAGAAAQGGTAPVGHDWTRFGWDARRSNASTDPTGITAETLGALQFQQVRLDGTVDASPIYLSAVSIGGASHDTFFVTTTYGKTIAVDADDGSMLWTYAPPGYDTWAGTYQYTTATPVADPGRDFIYTASPDGYIQKLAVADGSAVWRTAITRSPDRERIAASLNYFRGRVFATTGSYFDAPPYQGHVAALDAGSGALAKVWNALCSHRAQLIDPTECSESDAGIWGRAGAVIDPTTGHVFVATGNGHWNGRRHWGDAVIELDSMFELVGSYTPRDTNTLEDLDLDLGSTAPVLLDDGYIAQGGKDGRIRLVTLERMHAETPQRGGEIQTVTTPSGSALLTAPAVSRTAAAVWMFAADDYGTAAWRFRDGRLHERWRNSTPGTSPVSAGGLLYVYDGRGGLHIYEPGSGQEIAVLPCGRGHWNSPIVVDGRIALSEGGAAEQSLGGVLDIWRLPGRTLDAATARRRSSAPR